MFCRFTACTVTRVQTPILLSVYRAMRTMPKIGTHNGSFHCDEVLACFLLRQLPEYKDAEVIRSRDPAVLDQCDAVVDVGGVYDHSKKKYDHHQRTFSESMNSLRNEFPWTIKLSSAGLVYFHYGHQVIAQALDTQEQDQLTQVIYSKAYENFVQEIDAIDNGINSSETPERYAITTNVSSRVGHLNPAWNEESSEEDQLQRFHRAMDMVGAEFLDRLKYYSTSWWPARQLVRTALEKRYEIDSSGEILVFDQGGCPWQDHLMSLEESMGIHPHIKFVLYTDQSGKWRVQAVPMTLGSFDNRLSLMDEWLGLRDEELCQVAGIPGCIFVHANGFIGGNHTYEGALAMARKTLKIDDSKHLHVKTTRGLLPLTVP